MSFKKYCFAMCVWILSYIHTHAQQKYIVFFDKKDTTNQIAYISENTLENRKLLGLPLIHFSDYPVNSNYIETLRLMNVQIVTKLRWFNAVSIIADEESVQSIRQLPFVIGIERVQTYAVAGSENFKENRTYSQTLGREFESAGLTAKGVKVGVVDAGFYNADIDGALSYLFVNRQVIATRDFLNGTKVDFTSRETLMDSHGRGVLKMIAGSDTLRKIRTGCATDATYYLARTDHGVKETRMEEDLWVAAIEWLDSCGVRLVNTSLGYAKGHTDKNEDYQTSDMDGKTSIIARAASKAVNEKGMILVVSAGNEGNDKSWRIVSTPADTPEVISVGATTNTLPYLKQGYSSIGNPHVAYIKPELSCYSAAGTSFSAPYITGMVACMLQKNPSLTCAEVKKLLCTSAHLSDVPNNYLGYGVPSAKKIIQLLEEENTEKTNTEKIVVSKKDYTLNAAKNTKLLVYHKENTWIVTDEQTITAKKKTIITRPDNVNFSTIITPDRIIEIEWK